MTRHCPPHVPLDARRRRRGARHPALADAPEALPIAFSTLGCPLWSWKAILENADRLGYAGIELRGIAGEMDLPKVPELSGSRLAETKKDLAALGIVISDLGASARMHEKDPAAREKQLDEGRRFIDLAQALCVPYVRMFGDKLPPDEPKEEVMKRSSRASSRWPRYAKAAGVTVIIESHGDFTHSADLADDPDPRRLAATSRCSGTRTTRSSPARRRPPTPGSSSAAGAPHPPQGLECPKGPTALRPHRHRPGAGEGAGAGAGQGRLQGLLLLRVGEEVAPGDRGAGDRVPALREDHARVPGRGRREDVVGRTSERRLRRRCAFGDGAPAAAARRSQGRARALLRAPPRRLPGIGPGLSDPSSLAGRLRLRGARPPPRPPRPRNASARAARASAISQGASQTPFTDPRHQADAPIATSARKRRERQQHRPPGAAQRQQQLRDEQDPQRGHRVTPQQHAREQRLDDSHAERQPAARRAAPQPRQQARRAERQRATASDTTRPKAANQCGSSAGPRGTRSSARTTPSDASAHPLERRGVELVRRVRGLVVVGVEGGEGRVGGEERRVARLQERQVVAVEPHAERAHGRLVEPREPRVADAERRRPRRASPRAPRARATPARSPRGPARAGPRRRSGAAPGVPPLPARHLDRERGDQRPRARARAARCSAREPAVVPLPVDHASSPSNETNTIVRGRRSSCASTRASSIRIPTPPPSS